MPYSPRNCSVCGDPFQPRAPEQTTCKGCRKSIEIPINEPQSAPPEVQSIEGNRVCQVCLGTTREISGRHVKCQGRPAWSPPEPGVSREASELDIPAPPPFRQAVFDLETYCLDRNWGVLMMAGVLVHGDGQPKFYQYTLRDTEAFRAGRRGDDAEVFAKLYYTLEPCGILYAHNGKWFDIRWLNALCLKYGFAPLKRKLVDPVQLGNKNFAFSGNSLASQLDFIGAQEQKMPLGQSVWRDALLNDDPRSWELLAARNKSDCYGLNELAVRVAPYVGMVDFAGSAWR